MSYPRSAALQRIGDLVLGTDPKLRIRVSRTLSAGAAYGGFLVLQKICRLHGLSDPSFGISTEALCIAGPLLFLTLIRSGWSTRLADPAMTQQQTLFAIAAIVSAYATTPAARGATLMITALVLAFSAFQLTVAQSIRLTGAAIVMLGVSMVGLTLWRPAVYPLHEQVVQLLMLMVVLPVIAVLAGQTTALRRRRHSQRKEIEQALLNMERLATQDGLTGLLNRRCAQRLIDSELARRARGQAPFSVVLLDIDHFKRINDTHGHAAGDTVLRRLSQQALTVLATTDAGARWGGEEFLLLLPGTPLDAAFETAARLHRRMAEDAVWADFPQYRVTFSAGVAEHQVGESAERLIERADRALYRAKNQGRNRSCASVASTAATTESVDATTTSPATDASADVEPATGRAAPAGTRSSALRAARASVSLP